MVVPLCELTTTNQLNAITIWWLERVFSWTWLKRSIPSIPKIQWYRGWQPSFVVLKNDCGIKGKEVQQCIEKWQRQCRNHAWWLVLVNICSHWQPTQTRQNCTTQKTLVISVQKGMPEKRWAKNWLYLIACKSLNWTKTIDGGPYGHIWKANPPV